VAQPGEVAPPRVHRAAQGAERRVGPAERRVRRREVVEHLGVGGAVEPGPDEAPASLEQLLGLGERGRGVVGGADPVEHAREPEPPLHPVGADGDPVLVGVGDRAGAREVLGRGLVAFAALRQPAADRVRVRRHDLGEHVVRPRVARDRVVEQGRRLGELAGAEVERRAQHPRPEEGERRAGDLELHRAVEQRRRVRVLAAQRVDGAERHPPVLVARVERDGAQVGGDGAGQLGRLVRDHRAAQPAAAEHVPPHVAPGLALDAEARDALRLVELRRRKCM
jgi:hypothetical protein